MLNADICYLSDLVPIGVNKLSDAEKQIVARLVDFRHRHLRPTWLTLNVVSREHLETLLGYPTADRLFERALARRFRHTSYRQRAQGLFEKDPTSSCATSAGGPAE